MSNNKKLKSLFSIATVIVAVFVLLAALTSCEQVEDLTMKKGSLKVFASLKSSEVGKVDLTGAEYVYSITKDGVTSTLQGLYNSMVFADIPAGNYTVSVSAYVEGEKVAAGTVGYEVTVAASTQSECRVYLSALTSGGSGSGEGGSGGSGSGGSGSGEGGSGEGGTGGNGSGENQEDPIGLEITMIDLSGDEFGNQNFMLGKYEVTYAQWYDVYSWAVEHGYVFSGQCFEGYDKNYGGTPTKGSLQPAVGITWRDAIVWCNAASEKANLTPVYYSDEGFTSPIKKADASEVVTRSEKGSQDNPYVNKNADGFRLPTVWEWETAARAGKDYTYAGSNTLDDVAWYKSNSESTTHDVGTKKANAWGFYDMTGNVWERCVNWDDEWPVAKGGSWSNEEFINEITFVTHARSYDTIGDYGFRVCRSVVNDYSAKTLDSISVSTGNLNDSQRAFSPVGKDCFTVIARFTDGSTADVTDDAVFTTDSGETTWGSCMVYDAKSSSWVYDTTVRTVKISFTHNGKTLEYTSDGVTVKSQFNPNGYETQHVITNSEGSYLLIDIRGHYDIEIPVDENFEHGYLVEGTPAGTELWAIFSEEDFENDTPVTKDKLLAYAADVGAFIGGSETVPGFGDYYGFGNEGYVFVWSLDGSGRSGAEYVLVLGHVFNDITAESGIKKSDFYGDISNMTCYFIKQIAQ